MTEALHTAQELNTIRQLLTNWTGEILTPERTAKIIYHLARLKTTTQHDGSRFYLRLRVFIAYGGKCVCCDETNPDKLSPDHIVPLNGRKRRDPYKQAIAANFQRDRFQVLCKKCNSRKDNGAACPCGKGKRAPNQPQSHIARVVPLVRLE
jgi:5-methylcytosine-specific restriction endonuclease McrA